MRSTAVRVFATIKVALNERGALAGVFALRFGACLMRNTAIDFTRADIPFLRVLMCFEIARHRVEAQAAV